MKTFKRICIKDYTIMDEVGRCLTLERGKEYITSEVNGAPAIGPKPEKDKVIVFSNYWVAVPVDIFAGEIKFT